MKVQSVNRSFYFGRSKTVVEKTILVAKVESKLGFIFLAVLFPAVQLWQTDEFFFPDPIT